MKKKGSNAEFKAERDSAIINAYRDYLSRVRSINIDDIMQQVVRSPSPRFWVSEERAAAVVGALLRGDTSLADMTDGRARMYSEILNRVSGAINRRKPRTLISLIREVVYSPAPEFYISPHHAYNIICRHRRNA